MKIADIDLGERPVMLAPMEDVTDQSFRLICKELGADMTYSEFVSADTQYSRDHPETSHRTCRAPYSHTDLRAGSRAYGGSSPDGGSSRS